MLYSNIDYTCLIIRTSQRRTHPNPNIVFKLHISIASLAQRELVKCYKRKDSVFTPASFRLISPLIESISTPVSRSGRLSVLLNVDTVNPTHVVLLVCGLADLRWAAAGV